MSSEKKDLTPKAAHTQVQEQQTITKIIKDTIHTV